MIPSVLAGVGIVLYLLSAGLQWHSADKTRLARLLAAAAIAAHGVGLYQTLARYDSFEFGMGPAISLFAWQCALLVLLFSLSRPLDHLGLVVYPTAAAGAASVWLLPTTTPGSDFTGSWALAVHILLSLLAYGLLTIAAVQALVLMLQDRGLRQHHIPQWLKRLPPLESMESLLFQLMLLGFLLLTLSLFSGLLFIEDLFAQHLVHKTALSLLAWLIFATLLWGRWQFGWRGRKAINWTLGGYTGLLLAYFGSKWVLEILLNQHWG